MERKSIERILLLAVFFTVVNFMPVCVEGAELQATNDVTVQKLGIIFEELSKNIDKYEKVIDLTSDYLPTDCIDILDEVMFIAKLDISTEEKVDMFIETSGSNCSIYLRAYIVFYLLQFVPVADIIAPLITSLSFWGLIFCILGII